jgi:hypothetical protein
MSTKTSQRGANGSAGANGHANDSGATGAHAASESSQSQVKKGRPRRSSGNSSNDNGDATHLLGRTKASAKQDAAAFFDAVAARVDLVGASVRLIINEDLKISKSELDRVREMKFGKAGLTVVEESPRVDLGDLPRPER